MGAGEEEVGADAMVGMNSRRRHGGGRAGVSIWWPSCCVEREIMLLFLREYIEIGLYCLLDGERAGKMPDVAELVCSCDACSG